MLTIHVGIEIEWWELSIENWILRIEYKTLKNKLCEHCVHCNNNLWLKTHIFRITLSSQIANPLQSWESVVTRKGGLTWTGKLCVQSYCASSLKRCAGCKKTTNLDWNRVPTWSWNQFTVWISKCRHLRSQSFPLVSSRAPVRLPVNAGARRIHSLKSPWWQRWRDLHFWCYWSLSSFDHMAYPCSCSARRADGQRARTIDPLNLLDTSALYMSGPSLLLDHQELKVTAASRLLCHHETLSAHLVRLLLPTGHPFVSYTSCMQLTLHAKNALLHG